MSDAIRQRIDEMLHNGDRVEWRKFLKTCTMQDAVIAWVRASTFRDRPDMRELAFKRQEHLNGEHRHPGLWP